MKTSWFIGILVLFIVLSLVSGVVEWQFFSSSSDHEAIFERLFASPSLSWDILFAFWDALWFNYAQFQGSMQIVRWVLFIPVSAGVAIGLMLMLISAISNVVSGLGGLLRR